METFFNSFNLINSKNHEKRHANYIIHQHSFPPPNSGKYFPHMFHEFKDDSNRFAALAENQCHLSIFPTYLRCLGGGLEPPNNKGHIFNMFMVCLTRTHKHTNTSKRCLSLFEIEKIARPPPPVIYLFDFVINLFHFRKANRTTHHRPKLQSVSSLFFGDLEGGGLEVGWY